MVMINSATGFRRVDLTGAGPLVRRNRSNPGDPHPHGHADVIGLMVGSIFGLLTRQSAEWERKDGPAVYYSSLIRCRFACIVF
jgi:hypothetical protein